MSELARCILEIGNAIRAEVAEMGMHPYDINGVDDWEHLPFWTRARRRYDNA